jgi:hypothetical protein
MCSMCCVESETFKGFEDKEVQEFEQQHSLVEGKSPLMHTCNTLGVEVALSKSLLA